MGKFLSPKHGRYDRIPIAGRRPRYVSGVNGALAIPDSFIDELVSKTDITDLVSGYVRLTKRSGANMFGLCPFHSEKTPSFSVNSDKQICYCFGCHKGGGAINFIMEIESLSYPEAVEFLARRAGLTVPESGFADSLAGTRKRMLELNRDAARHFYEMLASPLTEQARSYLVKRKLTKAIVTRFGIGAAPDDWSNLIDAMAVKGYSKQELIDAGLARRGRNEGGAYDVFRNRLMFPVIDVRGNVIGFSGRIIGEGEPKYLNTPETLVFNKRRNLFALNLAKKTKSGMLILVEGNIDVVSLHQAGFDCAVASLGTSLTTEQARLMKRYTENAVISYDSDAPGKDAALRAIPLLEKAGMNVKVVDMGISKDPDEYLTKNGAAAFKVLIDRSDNHIEYRLLLIENRHDLTSDEGRLSYLAEATDLLSELESRPEREIYGAKAAKTAGISPESVETEVYKKYKARMARQKRDLERKALRPAAATQSMERELRYDNEYSAAAEEGVIRCLIREPSLLRMAADTGFSHEEFTSPFLAKIFVMLQKRAMEGRDTGEAFILSSLEPEEASLLTAVLQKPEAQPNSDRTVRDYINKIRTEKYKTNTPDDDMLLAIKEYKTHESC